MSEDLTPAWRWKLEPEAEASISIKISSLEISRTISAKRSADALERIADALDANHGQGFSQLLSTLEMIAKARADG